MGRRRRLPVTGRSAHTLVDTGDGGVRCTTCTATWRRAPVSTCPGVTLYRSWQAVPRELATRSMLRREKLHVPRRAAPVAVVENPLHHRFELFRREDARRIFRTDAAKAAWARTRALRGRCNDCGALPDRGEPLVRRHDSLIGGPPRRCWRCYEVAWEASEQARVERVRAEWSAELDGLAVIDFETTGLETCAAVEVGVWGPRGPIFESLVRPDVEAWEQEAMDVNGLSPEAVKDAPWWPFVAARLAQALEASGVVRLLAWGDFEHRVIGFERKRYGDLGAWPIGLELEDAREVYKALNRSLPVTRAHLEAVREANRGRLREWRPRLTQACAHLGVPTGGHRALPDARAAREVLDAALAPGRARAWPPEPEAGAW